MKIPQYRLEDSGDFVIENYNFAKGFCSFFPGIAGLYGIPLWAFYLNRGQGLASFGLGDKDGAILEFFPANQAYYLTPLKGFRTFLKINSPQRTVYEPFRETGSALSNSACRRMVINAYRLEFEELNRRLGLMVNVVYTTVPEEPYAALARRISLTNISRRPIQAEVIDGLPQIIPYGGNLWTQKQMSRTIEAWMRVSNLKQDIPFYALKVKPEDRPELEDVDRGNFYLAYKCAQGTLAQLGVIVDPELVFGPDAELNFPLAFAQSERFTIPLQQRLEGQTPSGLTHTALSLRPRQSLEIVSVIGNVESPERINQCRRTILRPDFFAGCLNRNKQLIGQLQHTVFTKSSKPNFDYYTAQSFLDNLLRGGFPYTVQTRRGAFVFYLYGRKHGDLERDYNDFRLAPGYFSQGNGAYRDINQNRRNDIFFNPDVGEDNIRTFVNALQLDGFNPLQINGSVLRIKNRLGLGKILNRYIAKNSQRRKLKSLLLKEFTPGEIGLFLEQERLIERRDIPDLINQLLAISAKEDLLEHGEGYWVDHWTYNLQLLENYLAVYPERQTDLLFRQNNFTFFDSCHRVRPRSEKYVYRNGQVRQYGAVLEDKHKRAMLAGRREQTQKVRTDYGRGRVYQTSLFVKLLNLAANKMASLDPFGIGIEMEADKPGWCDALNNMPAIFGSSVAETAELNRLSGFLLRALDQSGLADSARISLPEETVKFLQGLAAALKANLSRKRKNRDFIYWDTSAGLKEEYRRCTWLGLNGREFTLAVREIKTLLEFFLRKTQTGLNRSINPKTKIPYTYFFHRVTRYRFIRRQGKVARNAAGEPLVQALAFTHQPVAHFLEGPMQMLKLLPNPARRRRLYQAVRNSALFDRKLKMYKINAPLQGMPRELGRSMVFTPGWLENESIWLHMEYKYLLEVLRGGLHQEFFADLQNCLVPFMDPAVYGRSILENSSFIVSSAHPTTALHGSGFVARLSGSTTEFLSIWLQMTLGARPFRLDAQGRLRLVFSPVLARWLFTKQSAECNLYLRKWGTVSLTIPKDSLAFTFLGHSLVIYRNPRGRDTYGSNAVRPRQLILKRPGAGDILIEGNSLSAPYARAIRRGDYKLIEILLDD